MDFFNVYLPIAGIDFNVLVLILISTTVGVCGGFFGIGGAWMVTPALNIFGFPMPYAIGTDLAHMGGKSIIATIRHSRFGNVDIALAVSMIAGTTVGMELGAELVMHLERLGQAESIIRRFYVVFLFLIGTWVLWDYLKHVPRRTGQQPKSFYGQSTRTTLAERLHRINIPPMITYKTSGIRCSLWMPILVGLVTGVVAAVLGVGGGFIRMPALIYLLGCPTLVAVGTDLFEVMITGAYGGFTYGIKGRVDLVAAMWMLLGAAVGAQLGTIAVKYVRGYFIRLLFAITIYLLKQLEQQTASAILILVAGVGISSVIVTLLVRGMIRELAATRDATAA
jgi:uncharacterized membrane protein YfcA